MGYGRTFLLVLIVIILVIFLLPVMFLNISSQYLNPQLQTTAGEIFASTADMTFRHGTAAEVYDYLITLHPDKKEYYRYKANSIRDSADDEKAILAYDEALRLDPGNARILKEKIKIYTKNEQFDAAESVKDEILTLILSNSIDLEIAGDIALERDDYPKAYDYYIKSLEADPSSGIVYEKLGDVTFAFLTIPTAGINTRTEFKEENLYDKGMQCYKEAITFRHDRRSLIEDKISKFNPEFTPKSINDFINRYQTYRYVT